MRAKYVSCVVTICSSFFRLRCSTAPMATTTRVGPHSSHQRHHGPIAAHRHPLRCLLLLSRKPGAAPARFVAPGPVAQPPGSVDGPSTHARPLPESSPHARLPVQTVVRSPTAPAPPVRAATDAHPAPAIPYPGGKTRLHTAGRSHTCVPPLSVDRPGSATSVALVRVLAESDHTARTPVASLASLSAAALACAACSIIWARRRFICSSTACSISASVAFRCATLHWATVAKASSPCSFQFSCKSSGFILGSLFLTLGTTPFLFASVPPFASTLPSLPSKQAAQKMKRTRSRRASCTSREKQLYYVCHR
jgi:hypothetical protein